MKYCLFVFLVLFIIPFSFSQESYPKNYFDSPLKIPTILSGTFGELRNNHFHSGIDIKTQGKEGIKIYAPANGYVSRIKVSQWGFGKALYISHPNGYTTVYAHLKSYADTIQRYIKDIQYKKESYATGNIFPSPKQFPIKKGQLIGYTGDTGSSGGPHLHYEIRNTKTAHIINPMHFGLIPPDSIHPIFKRLLAFPLNENARVNRTSKKIILPIKKINDSIYYTDKITASGTIGFGVSVFDRLNKARNKNGIYSLEMKVNGNRIYYHDVETFSFAESKYINLLIDYEYYKKHKRRIQKTYKVKGNKLSIYENLINNGMMDIKDGHTYQVEIIAKDFKNNSTTLKVPVTGSNTNLLFKAKDTTPYKIIAKNFHKFQEKNVSIAFPKNTFYSDCYLDFRVENGIAKVHNPSIPLDKKYTLSFDISGYPQKEQKQLYIANVNNIKYPRYITTKRNKNKIYATVKSLGNYTLKTDTNTPKISLINFKNGQWVSKLKTLKVKISDKGSEIKDYNATINNKWILMEFNHKKGILTYNFNDKKLVGSKHIFKLVVSDKVGNTKSVSTTFFRK
ncbi:Peptidase family M23 [Tenacibaculum maritimum]|uniref:M23 family metallopeptidase n=1 Tax=Tenacibaculum maritimum TaxID=107401 RepID=UPI0012E46CCA|nr:M23 family metallopeptidase [Tenacibaculum maritimum]CAA0181394.1 Peptidase family M23 [Tenacibaculum maritimum]